MVYSLMDPAVSTSLILPLHGSLKGALQHAQCCQMAPITSGPRVFTMAMPVKSSCQLCLLGSPLVTGEACMHMGQLAIYAK